MRALRLLLFSDELSLMDANAREVLKGFEYQVFDETDATHAGATRQLAHGLEIDIAPVDAIEETISQRNAINRAYDAYALYTLRVWRLGTSLLEYAQRIRAHTGVAESGLRLACLPIVVMNPLDRVAGEDPRSGDFGALMGMPHVYAAYRDEVFADCVARALASWHTDLLGQLEYVGYAISLDAQGQWQVDAAFRRSEREAEFFAAPQLDALRHQSVFRVSRDALAIGRALAGLERALREAEGLRPKQREPRMQRCFEEYPELLTQGLFETLWAEPELPNADPLRRGIRPDFVAAGNPSWDHVLPPRVYELKSPAFRVAIARKATQDLHKALEQLSDRYRQYFADPRNRPIQEDRLGRAIVQPRLMLVIGRDRWKQDWLDLDELQAASEHDDVSIVSYDEIGAAGERQLDLLRRLAFRLKR